MAIRLLWIVSTHLIKRLLNAVQNTIDREQKSFFKANPPGSPSLHSRPSLTAVLSQFVTTGMCHLGFPRESSMFLVDIEWSRSCSISFHGVLDKTEPA